jgi:hypothetical protein
MTIQTIIEIIENIGEILQIIGAIITITIATRYIVEFVSPNQANKIKEKIRVKKNQN